MTTVCEFHKLNHDERDGCPLCILKQLENQVGPEAFVALLNQHEAEAQKSAAALASIEHGAVLRTIARDMKKVDEALVRFTRPVSHALTLGAVHIARLNGERVIDLLVRFAQEYAQGGVISYQLPEPLEAIMVKARFE